jgi:tetratricopeptide (TPR) repeat protein
VGRGGNGRARAVVSQAALSLTLALLTVAVYAPVRHHEFFELDDWDAIVWNQNLRASSAADAFVKAFGSPFRSRTVNWTPLTVLSLQLDHALYGEEPAGYLVTNVALHVLSTLVLFHALVALTGALGCSAFVAAVFAVHPLHVESVAWVSERKDVLSGLFWNLTLAAYARFVVRPRSAVRYGLVLLCLVLGLLSKPMVVTLPFVLLLLDYWPLRRLDGRALREKIPMLTLVALVAISTYLLQRAWGAMEYGETIGSSDRIRNAIDSYGIYLADAFWPTGLAVIYPHPVDSLATGRVVLVALGLAAATGIAFALRRSHPYGIVGWLWYLGTLVPVIGIVQVGLQARADRYMYLPIVGLAIIVAFAARDAARGRVHSIAVAAAGIGAIVSLAIAASIQLTFWKDSVTLYERAIEVSPEGPRPYERLGELYMLWKDFEKAERYFRRQYELDPEAGSESMLRVYAFHGDALKESGDLEGAVARYRRALEFDPQHAHVNRRLGLALVASGRSGEARPALEIALRGLPRHAPIHAALGYVALEERRFQEAIAYNRRALELSPRLRQPRNNLAWLLATAPDPSLLDPAEAVRLAEGLRDETETPSPNLLDTLAAAYAADGRLEQAIRASEQSVALAEERGASELAQTLRSRLARYRSGQRFVDAPPSR